MTTKQQILTAALCESEQHGYSHISRDQIAQRAEVPPSLVSYHFGTMVELRRAIMSEAIRVRNLDVIAQGLVDGHAKAKRAPDDLKKEVLLHLMGR